MSDQELLDRERNSEDQEGSSTSDQRSDAETNELDNLSNDSRDGGLYKPGNGKQNLRTRARSALSGKKSRRRLIAGTILGGSSVMLIFLLIFIVSSLTIPNFMEHVTAYQFTRTTRDFMKSSEEIQGEKIMLDTAADGAGTAEQGAFKGMLERYKDTKNGIWDKVNSYRPEKVVDKLETTGRLSYEYEPGVSIGGFTRERLTKITLDGEEIAASNPTFAGRLLHPIQTFKDKIDFRSDLSDGVATSLEGRNTLFRSFVAKDIRGRTNARLVRWVRNKTPDPNDPKDSANYEGDSKVADRLNAKESADVATDNGKTQNAATSEELLSSNKDAEAAATEAFNACLEDPACLDETIASGSSTPRPVLSAIDSALQSTILDKITSTVSTAAAVAIPACLIFDGSIEHSKNTIDSGTDSNIRSYTSEAAIWNQQQAGQNVTAGAINANVRALQGTEGIGATAVELRANNIPIDTSQYASTETSASQSFTLLDAIPGAPSVVVDFFNGAADKVCPLITNTYALIGLGAGQVIFEISSGGSVNLADEGLKAFATTAIKDFFDKFSAKEFTKSLIKTGAAIGGATFLAKMIVSNRASSVHNGLARGKPLAAEIDAGGNAMANYVDQKMFYGSPMNNYSVAASAAQDREYLAHQQSQLPAIQRYFALSNPDSLLTKFGTVMASYVNLSTSTKLLNGLGHILNPMSSFATVFSHWGRGTVLADSEVDNTNYGQVQFGWSPDEQAKIDSDASYQHPLENQYQLDASGQEDAIAKKYGDCFTETIGQLLSEKKIQRNAQGNVIDNKGLCSPQNLSYNNPEGFRDNVFRWRISHKHINTLQHLTEIQNVQVAP